MKTQKAYLEIDTLVLYNLANLMSKTINENKITGIDPTTKTSIKLTCLQIKIMSRLSNKRIATITFYNEEK